MMDPVTVWLGESQLDAPGPALAQDLLGFGAGEANVIALEYRARVAMRLDMSEEVVRRAEQAQSGEPSPAAAGTYAASSLCSR